LPAALQLDCARIRQGQEFDRERTRWRQQRHRRPGRTCQHSSPTAIMDMGEDDCTQWNVTCTHRTTSASRSRETTMTRAKSLADICFAT
jgi:hypothetical protein